LETKRKRLSGVASKPFLSLFHFPFPKSIQFL